MSNKNQHKQLHAPSHSLITSITIVAEKKKKKKKKNKKKNKKPAADGTTTTATTNANTTANGQAKPIASLTINGKRQESKDIGAKGQTFPPTIPVSQLFPSGIFPAGEIQEHPLDM